MSEWQKLFDRLGVGWCQGCVEHKDLHNTGWLETHWIQTEPDPRVHEETLHWRNRRMAKQSAHKALRRIVEGRHPEYPFLPPWRALYLLHRELNELESKAGRRFPRSYDDLDRARMRYMLSEYRLEDRRRMTPSEQQDFRAAIRWAARS